MAIEITRVAESRILEKHFIAWYRFDGEEDYMIITAADEDEARRRAHAYLDNIIELHEIEESEGYLAYA